VGNGVKTENCTQKDGGKKKNNTLSGGLRREVKEQPEAVGEFSRPVQITQSPKQTNASNQKKKKKKNKKKKGQHSQEEATLMAELGSGGKRDGSSGEL